jgi:Uma2 family endonuclease
MEITEFSQLDLTKSYTYFDYLGWKFQERIELFKGKIMKMSPALSSQHQNISSDIFFALRKHIEGNNCKVFFAPFDVRLMKNSNDKQVKTVVQPDICVICDLSKIDEKGCNGAPELVIEILSPGNSNKEMKNKFELYEEAGVLEYWIVDPEKEVVFQYVLESGIFTNHRPLVKEDMLESNVIEGFRLDLSTIF